MKSYLFVYVLGKIPLLTLLQVNVSKLLEYCYFQMEFFFFS